MDGGQIANYLLIISIPFWLATLMALGLRGQLIKYPVLLGTMTVGFQIGTFLGISGLGLNYWEGRYENAYFRYVLIPFGIVATLVFAIQVYRFRQELIKSYQKLNPKSI